MAFSAQQEVIIGAPSWRQPWIVLDDAVIFEIVEALEQRGRLMLLG